MARGTPRGGGLTCTPWSRQSTSIGHCTLGHRSHDPQCRRCRSSTSSFRDTASTATAPVTAPRRGRGRQQERQVCHHDGAGKQLQAATQTTFYCSCCEVQWLAIVLSLFVNAACDSAATLGRPATATGDADTETQDRERPEIEHTNTTRFALPLLTPLPRLTSIDGVHIGAADVRSSASVQSRHGPGNDGQRVSKLKCE